MLNHRLQTFRLSYWTMTLRHFKIKYGVHPVSERKHGIIILSQGMTRLILLLINSTLKGVEPTLHSIHHHHVDDDHHNSRVKEDERRAQGDRSETHWWSSPSSDDCTSSSPSSSLSSLLSSLLSPPLSSSIFILSSGSALPRRNVLGNTFPRTERFSKGRGVQNPARGKFQGPREGVFPNASWQFMAIFSALAGKYWFCGMFFLHSKNLPDGELLWGYIWSPHKQCWSQVCDD